MVIGILWRPTRYCPRPYALHHLCPRHRSYTTNFHLQYADDTVLLGKVDKTGSCPELSADLTQLSLWCNLKGMQINGDKSEVVRFSLVQNPNRPLYFFNNTVIPEALEHRHLGVIVSHDLKYSKHILFAIGKARGALFSIHRNFSKCSLNVRKKLVDTIVLPILLYGVPAWLPVLQIDKDHLISFQGLITKVVLGFPRPRIDFFTRLASLDYLNIEYHIDFITLCYLYRNDLGTPIFPLRLRRSNLEIKKDFPMRSTLYKKSYFFRVITVWNKLPDSVKRSTIRTFSTNVFTHFKFKPN